jgi:diguanylate cyclase (GGDEF)-like protein
MNTRTGRAAPAILEAVLDHLPVGISVIDRDLNLVAINQPLIKLLDFPAWLFASRLPTLEELTRFNARRGEYGPGEEEALVEQRMALARRAEAHGFRRTRPDGTVLEITGAPLPDGGFVTVYMDVTARQQAEEALQENALYLRSVVDHLAQGISVFDDQLRLKCWNSIFLDVLDLPQENVYPDVPFDELITHPARRGEYGPGDPAGHVAARRALAMKFEPHSFERTRPNGRTHLVEGRPMRTDGKIVGFVTSYTDITERRAREVALSEKTALLQTLIDNIPGGVTVFDRDLRLVLYNDEARRLLDFPPELLEANCRYADLVRWNAGRGEYGDVDVEDLVARMVEEARRPVPHRVERVRPNGTVIEIRGAPMPHGGFVTVCTDITELKGTESELRHKNEVFQTLVDNIPGGVTLFDAELRLVAHNEEFRRLLGFPDDLFSGPGAPTLERLFRFNALRGEYGPGDAEPIVAQLLSRARQRQPHKFERTRPDGTVLEVRGLPLADGGFVTVYTDITEHRRAAEAIEKLAHIDTLTGLANRYTLEARLDQLVADAKRHHGQLAVMFIDMDNFKSINDTLGHAVGDEFLVETARRLRGTVRDNDVVARLGGDEFVIVLSDVRDPGDITTVAGKITRSLAEPVVANGNELRSSASIGICAYPEDGKDRGALMQSADIAMYHAKYAGKGVFRFFDAAMMTAANQRLELEGALHEALARRQFVMHYQPQLSGPTSEATGVEALIRWRRSDGKLVAPSDFIPLAEETGLINAIGEWALREACRTVAAWHRQGLAVSVAVNLSAAQLRNPALPQSIAAALDESGLPPASLTLEVTESVAMEDPRASIALLGTIRDLGVRLAIDDFGTGYSSLAYLKRLPLDYLKLDRTFVADLETDPNDAAISAATIGLAHNLGLKVIAEGVETAGQRAYLAGLACDGFQGFLFSRALAAGAAYDWLIDNQGRQAVSWDI